MPCSLGFMPDRPDFGFGADVLADVLASLRLRAWLYSRTEITAPCRFAFTPSQDSVFHIIGSGGGYLLAPDATAQNKTVQLALAEGDVVVFPHGDAHIICDDPESRLTNEVTLEYDAARAHRIFPFSVDGTETGMLCGAFHLDHESPWSLLRSLPRLIHIGGSDGRVSPEFADIVALIATESKSGRPGAESVLRRLTEILFIQILRAWVQDQPRQARGWLLALADPRIGPALSLIHEDPERPWNLKELADAAAMSRSTFSARFAELVGEPPIKYLTRWRMEQATRLLANGHEISRVAGRLWDVGDVACRNALAREIGTPPGRYRLAAQTKPR